MRGWPSALVKEGFRAKEAAKKSAERHSGSRCAVPGEKRGERGGPNTNAASFVSIDRLIEPLADRPGESREMVRRSNWHHERPEREEALRILRERLKLEPAAAEKYLELSNQTDDDHYSSKMLLRIGAADGVRQGDVVSQVVSWLEAGRDTDVQMPGKRCVLAGETRRSGGSLPSQA